MAKILKKILYLIPFLIVSLSIKNVYADSSDLYLYGKFYRLGFDSFRTSAPSDTKFTYNIGNFYNYNLFIATTNTNGFGNYISFYNSSDDYYIFIFSEGLENYIINLTSSYRLQMCSDINSCNDTNYTTYRYYIYKDINTLDKIVNNYNLDSSSVITKEYNDDLYISYISERSIFLSMYKKNFFDNLYYNKSKNGYYIDLVLQETNIPEEPEEPEEPDTPTPPIIEDLDLIYVPNYKEGNCVEIIDKDTIRVFENENTSDYSDYFINSHYISKQGQTDIDYIKSCSNLKFTDKYYYRNDFPQILFIAICLCGGSTLFVYTLFKRFRKR